MTPACSDLRRHVSEGTDFASTDVARRSELRLAVLLSHPIQYYTPIFRALAARCELHVFYGQKLTPQQQGSAGFGTAFDWDIDLLSGYPSTFLRNVSRTPGPEHFGGCDTPEIGTRLRAGGFDALLVIGWHLKSYMQGVLAAKRAGLPVLVRGDSHLDTPRSALKRSVKELVNPLFLRLFDRALYVGQKSKAFYEHYRYPASRLFFSPHCIDNDWFAARATTEARVQVRRSHGIRKDAFLVLFAGKLVAFKRPLDVVASAARCRIADRPVEVMVAGSGELESEMRRRAGELGVPLHMLGFCNQTQMPAAYAAADVLVLPSNGEETWGLVAIILLRVGHVWIERQADCLCVVALSFGTVPRPEAELGIVGVSVYGHVVQVNADAPLPQRFMYLTLTSCDALRIEAHDVQASSVHLHAGSLDHVGPELVTRFDARAPRCD